MELPVLRALSEIVGRVTVKSRPPGVEMVQVFSVILPFNVTLPSAAFAESGAKMTTKAAKHLIVFNSINLRQSEIQEEARLNSQDDPLDGRHCRACRGAKVGKTNTATQVTLHTLRTINSHPVHQRKLP